MGEQEVLVKQETANDKESETYSISQSVSLDSLAHSLARWDRYSCRGRDTNKGSSSHTLWLTGGAGEEEEKEKRKKKKEKRKKKKEKRKKKKEKRKWRLVPGDQSNLSFRKECVSIARQREMWVRIQTTRA